MTCCRLRLLFPTLLLRIPLALDRPLLPPDLLGLLAPTLELWAGLDIEINPESLMEETLATCLAGVAAEWTRFSPCPC